MRLLIEAKNAVVAIADGYIVEPQGTFDHTIDMPHGEIRPGLINAHDHLHRNHYGRLGCPPYANAYEWARDIQTRHADRIAKGRSVPRRAALLAGAWKNLIAGVTHVVHHDVWEADFDADFPIDVVRIAHADSLGMTPALAVPHGEPFALHVAEGVDAQAAAEIHELDECGWLSPDLIAVHAVGADGRGIEKLRKSGATIVWCPTSNQFLFSRTLPKELLAEDIPILLGTDSLLTGAGTLLDEIRAARQFLSDGRLMDMVGPLAARTLSITLPSLAPGIRADLALFRRPMPEADVADVVFVMVDGQLRVLDAELAVALDVQDSGGILHWRGLKRWISEENDCPSHKVY